MPQITKIVLTGGPCAGKSTALARIRIYFTQKGYTVLFIAETATELITGGVKPQSCGTPADFQNCLFDLQLKKEEIYTKAAKTMNAKKVLIVCDRGALDNKAYMSEEEFACVLRTNGINEAELRDSYGAVFHLVTAAKGAEEYYTTANNNARTETPEQAAALDDKLIAAWAGHPHMRVIDNASGFDSKMNRLITEISSYLGEPHPLVTERKYLIEYPDLEWLESRTDCQKIEMIQTYLKSNSGDEVRVRQWGADGNYIYSKTVKKTISAMQRIQTEKLLSREDYLDLLLEADTSKRQICKTRYCLSYEGQYLEIDVFPFWNDKAIAEVKLSEENAKITFPEQIKVIKEVTEDESYKNAALATI